MPTTFNIFDNLWSFVSYKTSFKVSCGCKPSTSTEDACSMQTRRRSQKCIEKKVDDTICPCVETRKCQVPTCPVQVGKKYLPPMCVASGKTFPTDQQLEDKKIVFSVTQCKHFEGSDDYKD